MKRGPGAARRRQTARRIILAFLFCGAAVSGSMLGLLFAYQSDIPFIEELERHESSATSIIFDRHGEEIGQFAVERRIEVDFETLPQHLRDAFVSAEDQRFWSHFGFDLAGIARAAWDAARAGRIVSGASTITQQVARTLFLNREKSLKRKIREAITAIRIERAYRKEEILTFYANQIFLGHGNHGIEAAAQYYFGKTTPELTVGEAALLVSLAPNPSRFSPYRSLERATARRDMVLMRMLADGHLTEAQTAAARAEPVHLRPRGADPLAPHFLEMVRQHLASQYGSRRTYEGGLRVHTTLDPDMQRAANEAVDVALRAHDKRRGFRGFARNLVDEGVDMDTWRDSSWSGTPEADAVVAGVVVEAGSAPRIRIGDRIARVDPESLRWTGRPAARLFRRGDVGAFRIRESGEELLVGLEQEPAAEGALLALDVESGAIRALVGGHDFERSEFNRATQARRQAGSSFKPFSYGAALASGRFAPTSLLLDAPFSWTDPATGVPYEPRNYDEEHRGWITLRRALEGSRNVPAVRMVHDVGPENVVAFAKSLGIASELLPVLSITLGSADVTLLEMVSAYSAFPNRGVRMEPHFITLVTDRDGRVLERRHPESASVMDAELAYVLTHLLQGVVARGTARGARGLGRPVAGKTGTTNDFTDAWFIGFDTRVAAGVWVGNDQNETLGDSQSGAAVALPAWRHFMTHADTGAREWDPFHVPSRVPLVPVDLDTGRPAPEGPNTILEAFLPGTEPASRNAYRAFPSSPY